MNKLIKELGGYERAKHEFKMIEEMTPKFPDEVKTNNRLLLEYRREHNIFEVGDWAVNMQGYPTIHKVEIGSSTAHCMKIFSHDMSHSYWVHDVAYRHATDAEIKAGRRL